MTTDISPQGDFQDETEDTEDTPRRDPFRKPTDEDYIALAKLYGGDTCETCYGLGVLHSDGRFVPCPHCENGRRKAAAEQARLERLAHIPDMYADASLDDIDALPADKAEGKRKAYKVLRLFVERGGNVPTTRGEIMPRIILSGQVGTGKTHAAVAAINAMKSSGRVVRFSRLAGVFDHVQGLYGENGQPDALAPYKIHSPLVIDEVGVPRITEDKQRIFEELIRYRYDHQLPTIMTTNISKLRLQEAGWGDRINTVLDNSAWVTVTGNPMRDYAVQVDFDDE